MRKILSFLTAVLFAGSMMADSYVKVTEAPTDWSGDYLIVYEGDATHDAVAFNGGLETLDANSNNVAVTITDGVIAATNELNAAKFTIAAVTGGYSVQAANGKFIGATSYANSLVAADEAIVNNLSIADGNAVIGVTTSGGDVSLRYNYAKNTWRFRYYKSGQQAVALYKFVASQGSGEDPQPVQHTYTVAGSDATLFGTSWDTENTDNDMVLQEDNTYKWEKADLTLDAGEIMFKVCQDHAWDVAYPEQNYQLVIAEAGVYTITITYNPADNNAVNAVAQKAGSAVVIPTVAMHGNFGGQNWADTENFAVAEGNETASLTLNLAAGDYEFGMRIGGSDNWTANGAAFTRENNSAVIEAGQGNITLDADAAGEYTFTWTYATNTLTVTYPEYVEPTYNFADGYYLIGLDMADWNMENMPAEGRLFAANPDNEGEYQLTITLAADQQFKVVSVQKDQIKNWYPDGYDNNYIVDAAHVGEKTVYFRPDGQGGEGWHYGCIYVAANEEQPEQPEEGTVIVKWDADAEQVIGQVIYHAAAATATTKLHNNEDNVTAINLSGSYKYASDQYVVIKPAIGTFKAGDKVTFNTFINNATADGSKYGRVQFYAANGTTKLFEGQNGINGRTSNDEPVVENFTLEADQDSILFGRYGNTATYLSVLNVTRVGGETPVETPKFYITGESLVESWEPNARPSYENTYVFENLATGEYVFKITVDGTWQTAKGFTDLTAQTPGVLQAETDDNIYFRLEEAGDVTITYDAENFTVAGNFYVAPVVEQPKYYLIGDSAFVVDAGATADKAWTPDAIPSYNDTTVLNLKAGQDYIMRLSLNGTWENHRDFRHLTDTAAGLIELPDEYQNRSIGFKLAEAGEVKVVYIPATEEQPEVFKLIGNFYVAPDPDPTVSVMGSMNEWAEEIPFVLSDDKTYASLTVENISADNYDFKFIVNGEWRSNGYTYHRGFPGAAGITENNDQNMIFQADVDGEYTFYWYFANDSAAIVYPAAPVVVPAKFYITGDSALVVDAGLEADKAWAPAAIKVETDTMALTLKAKQAYTLKITLDGDWATGRGYSSLSEKPEGITTDADDNIIFTLVENGAVNVIYVATEDTTIFKVEGNFYVAPAPDPTVAVMGSMNEWAEEIPFVLSDDKTYASLTVENISAGEYEFKFIINGEWRSNGYRYHRDFTGAAGITENNDANMVFVADQDGEYTFYWYFANDSAAIVYPELEPEQPVDSMTVYFINDKGWENIHAYVWIEDDTHFAQYVAWPGEAVTLTEQTYNDMAIYSYTFPNIYPNLIFNGTLNEESKQTGDQVWDAATPYYYADTWYASLEEIPEVIVPAKFYICGNAALVGEDKAGQYNAIKVTEDSYIFENLAADVEYSLKISLDGTWQTVMGFSYLTDTADGLHTNYADDILFTLAEAGNVVVTYIATEEDTTFTVTGNFAPYVEPTHTYTVAGNNTTLFGTAWTPANADNDMVLDDESGLYKWEMADAALAAGTIEFKICVDHDWTPSYPADNYQFAISETGTYTVTITYNPDNHSINAVANKTGEAEVDPTAAVRGEFNNWEGGEMTLSEDKASASITFTLSAANYLFKMVINDDWRGNGYSYHREFNTIDGLTMNGTNMVLQADVDGDYTFTWTFATNTMTITFPERQDPVYVLTNGYYLVGNFGGVDAWSIEDLSADKLFEQNPDDETEYQLTINLEANDALKVVYVENDAIVTWFPAEGGNYVIDDHHNGATTMYFRPDYQGGEDWFAGCIYVVPTSTVDIDNVNAAGEATKILRDGQILIIKGEKMYNVMGQTIK